MNKLLMQLILFLIFEQSGLCQNYSNLLKEQPQSSDFNIIIQSESFIEEKGYSYILYNNKYCSKLPIPYDSIISKKNQMYRFNYFYIPSTGSRELIDYKTEELSKLQLDSVLYLIQDLIKIENNKIFFDEYSDNLLPFDSNEGYSGFVILDICGKGKKFRIDLSNTELNVPSSSPYDKLIEYLNKIFPARAGCVLK